MRMCSVIAGKVDAGQAGTKDEMARNDRNEVNADEYVTSVDLESAFCHRSDTSPVSSSSAPWVGCTGWLVDLHGAPGIGMLSSGNERERQQQYFLYQEYVEHAQRNCTKQNDMLVCASVC